MPKRGYREGTGMESSLNLDLSLANVLKFSKGLKNAAGRGAAGPRPGWWLMGSADLGAPRGSAYGIEKPDWGQAKRKP